MKRTLTDKFWYWVKIFVVAGTLAFLIRAFILVPVQVSGTSMEETLTEKDYILMERMTPIKRFDIIVFGLPNGETYVKRVIGLPGEHVAYQDDQLYIDGVQVDEPFLPASKKNEGQLLTTDLDAADITGTETIPDEHYFVLGDNRRLSKDSRSFGAVPADKIFGKARMVYFPLQHFGIIN